MKKLMFLIIVAVAASSAEAQTSANGCLDSRLSRWVLDVNAIGGGFSQSGLRVVNTRQNYLNGFDMNTGRLSLNHGKAIGGDAQIGYFFDANRHWGAGVGFLYIREWNEAHLDQFHVAYQSIDDQGFIFRQITTADNGITEKVKIDNYNIPVVIKYKYRFSEKWGVAADAGAVFNLSMKNHYSTDAIFDYEAIYQFTHRGDGSLTSVYDNGTPPSTADFLLTRAHFTKNNPDGNVQNYFDASYNQGYNVGLGVRPNNHTGTVIYKRSIGILFQPSANYFFSDRLALSIGGYFLFQPFNNSTSSNYMLTNRVGEYSSVLHTVSHVDNYSYGGNLGLRFFLGSKQTPLAITSIEPTLPTRCGTCDGAMTIHGLPPGKNVTVNYSLDGTPRPSWTGVAGGDGTVTLTGLCKGNYTNLTASIGKRSVNGNSIMLTEPELNVTQTSTNITAYGACDATITLGGLYENHPVTVNYTLNGTPQPAYTTTAEDKTLTMKGLCAGAYTNITTTVNGCKAKTPDVVFFAPPPPPPVRPVVVKIDISTPILFNFNKATFIESAYPVLKEAIAILEADKNAALRIDGHTDAIGSRAYNNKLSQQRAIAVKKYLISSGIKSDRIKIVGHGKDKPGVPNTTARQRAINRRAVMKLVQK